MNFLHAFTREFVEMTEMPATAGNASFHEKSGNEQDDISPGPNVASDHNQPETPNPDESSLPTIEPPERPSSCTVATYLRLGAIFAIFIPCLLGM